MWLNDSGARAWLFWQQPLYRNLNFLVVRRQLQSGLCYMHAPIVLQHYKEAGSTRTSGYRTIAISSYLRGEALERYLLEGVGSSEQLLLEIANITEADIKKIKLPKSPPQSQHQAAALVVENLRLHGPGLVAEFRVDSTFADGMALLSDGMTTTALPRTSFVDDAAGTINIDDATVLGLHAMVIIGYREREDGSYVFLLQNWWRDRHFVEVSAAYLAQAEATCVFITTERIKSIDIARNPQTVTVDGRYAETKADVGDCISPQKRTISA